MRALEMALRGNPNVKFVLSDRRTAFIANPLFAVGVRADGLAA